MMNRLLLILSLLISIRASAQEYEYSYNFFTNSSMPGNWFFSRGSCSGGSTVMHINSRLPVSETVFHTPGNSLELKYYNAPGGNWNTVIFHQDRRGMDHHKKTATLSFWIYSESGGIPTNQLPQLHLMKRDSSMTSAVSLPLLYPGQWQQFLVPIGQFDGMEPAYPEDIIAVVFAQRNDAPGSGHTIYVDDVEFVPEKKPGPVAQEPVLVSARGYAMHCDIRWEEVADSNVHLVKIYRSENDTIYDPVGIQQPYTGRYADFTGETGKTYAYKISFLNGDYQETELSSPISVSTTPMTNDQLLTMVQEASFRYYWEGAEPVSGMARENIPGRHNMIATGASGFGIMALIAGTERNFITRDESVGRFLKILDFLEKADRFHGVYGHFMDGPTGKVEPFFGNRDNGADLVETAFLMQGLLAARQYFSGDNENERMIREKITKIWEEAEWDWFRKEPDSKYLYWHWSPDQAWVINHRLIGWNETMIVYLLAISSPTHGVPAEMYYSGWASQDRNAQNYRSGWGQSNDGSMYANGNNYYGISLDVGVNNGGPLFFTHYSYMGCDPHFITDKYTNYFKNNKAIAMINYNYCVANPKNYKGYGEDGWGLTASDGPYGYSADEPVEWQDHGKLTPTGAIGSFPYTPEESLKALKNYYYNYGRFLWGEYGFRDAFDLTENWCSEIYMGLNQAPQAVMIENYRTGLIWELFMQNEEIREGLRKVQEAGSR